MLKKMKLKKIIVSFFMLLLWFLVISPGGKSAYADDSSVNNPTPGY